MKYSQMAIGGAWLIEPEKQSDERGFFARLFDAREFAERGLATNLLQHSLSYNTKRGTLRGLHWQADPHGEEKLIRCTMGAVFDVVVDVRPDSPTFRHWVAIELTAENRRQLYLPRAVAHGFLTLRDDCELHYQISAEYHPELARGARWNDPAFAIEWPVAPKTVSDRDREFPDFKG